MLNVNLDDVSLNVLSVLRFGLKKGFFFLFFVFLFLFLFCFFFFCKKKYIYHARYGMRSRFLLFRINLNLPIRNPLNGIMLLLSIMYFLTKNAYLFLGVWLKKNIYHVTKGVKRLFFQMMVSFGFLKSILHDAIVDIKMIFKFGLKVHFLDTF